MSRARIPRDACVPAHISLMCICSTGRSDICFPGYGLALPDPFSRRALSIRDDKRPCEKGLVQFTALTRSRTQHGGAGC